MTKDELWRVFVRGNPVFAREDRTEVRMTARGIRKLFDQTWDQAERAGTAKAEAGKSLFDRIFGGSGQ